MEDQAKQISEIFAAPRGELQVVADFGGVRIYTSSKLKQGFVKAMAKTSRTAPIASTILKLIGKNELIPCYLTNKIINSILKKQPPEFKGYAGTTFGKHILVYVEAEANIFGFASNNELSVTTLHELIHRTANQFPSQFFSTFKGTLVEYYSTFWNELFSLKVNSIDKKKVEAIVGFLFMTSERSKRNNEVLVKYNNMLIEAFKESTTLDEKTFLELVQQYIVMIKLVWKAMDAQAPNIILKVIMVNKDIISKLYNAYSKTFGIKVRTMKELCYQELYAPSEVISIPALIKRPDPKVYKLIKKL